MPQQELIDLNWMKMIKNCDFKICKSKSLSFSLVCMKMNHVLRN